MDSGFILSERFRKWQPVNVADALDGFFPFQEMGFVQLVRMRSLRKLLQNLMPQFDMIDKPAKAETLSSDSPSADSVERVPSLQEATDSSF